MMSRRPFIASGFSIVSDVSIDIGVVFCFASILVSITMHRMGARENTILHNWLCALAGAPNANHCKQQAWDFTTDVTQTDSKCSDLSILGSDLKSY